MITVPSLQSRFTWIWSRDPALASPGDGAETSERETWEQRLDIARETGRWSDLLREGEQPTQFHVRPLPGSLLRRITDEVGQNKYGVTSAWALVVRLCLRAIENPTIEVKTEKGPYGEVAKLDVIETLDGIDPHIVTELGAYLWARAGSPPGK
jgi:hypothetical protein